MLVQSEVLNVTEEQKAIFRVRLSWSKYVALLTSDPEELGFFLNCVESAVNLDWEAPQKEKLDF